MTPLSMAALPDFSAGVTIAIVAIVFIILWRQFRHVYMLAFGIAFGSLAEVLILRGIEESIGPLPWRAPTADASFIAATAFLLAGCIALSGRRIPWIVLFGGGAG